jgi:hypothetical protein
VQAVNDILARAAGLARQLAQTWLQATVFRVVWSMPLARVLLIAAVIFVVLSLFSW